jgi:hypothetical protein
MGFNGGYGGGGQSRGGFGRGGSGGKYEPKPGSGTLFVKSDKRNQASPDYDGYFIPDRNIQAGEKIKLVGWDKQGSGAPMITLKLGRERQDAPGYENGQGGGYGQPQQGFQPPQQGGYRGAPQQGYGNGPQNYGGQAPQQGYRQPPPAAGSYQGGGYGGQPLQTYTPPAGQAPAPAAPAAPAYPQPPPDDTLPF